MRVFTIVLLPFFFLLFGCAGQHHNQVTDESGVACPLPLPAVYSASLPCQDCSNRKVFLTLYPNKLYFLRISTIVKDATGDDVKAEFGTWKYIAQGNVIYLSSYDKSEKSLVITPSKNIKVMTESGGSISVGENKELVHDLENTGFTDTVPLVGMYQHTGGQATFTECLTGKTFPIVKEEGCPGLNQTYKNTPHAQEEPLLVHLEGRFVSSFDEDGLGAAEAVLPVRFVDIRPGIECSGEKTSTLSLTDSNWSLLELMGQPIELRTGQNRPFITLFKKGKRVKGFGGCNHFSGTYFRLGDVFLFNKRVGTRMACVDCMEMEFTFFQVLKATDGYHIEDNILEFRDRDRNVLARFEHAGRI